MFLKELLNSSIIDNIIDKVEGFLCNIEVSGYTIPVYDNSIVVRMTGSNIAVAVTNSKGSYIAIDNNFSKLSLNCKNFILHHEAYHIIFCDFEDPENRMFLCDHGSVSSSELKADMFAAERIGYDNAIKALCELLCFCKNNNIDCDYNEIMMRLKKLVFNKS